MYTTDDLLALWWHGEVRLPEDQLIAWLKRQRLLPLMGWRAAMEGWELPEAIAQAIRRRRMLIAVSQTLADQQLKALGTTAQQLGIPVVLVKGAAAAKAYPEPWMRPFGDIDLLVRKEDAHGFVEALRAQGYTRTVGTEGTRGWHLPPLQPAGRGLSVEIHTALAWDQGRSYFTMDQWKGHLHPTKYPGLQMLPAVDHVLYLTHHGAVHHGFEMGVQPLADIYFWTQGWTRRDWEALAEKAHGAQLHRAVCLCLALTAWFWDEPHSAEVAALFPEPEPSIVTLSQTKALGTASQWVPHLWRDASGYNLPGILRFAKLTLVGDPAQLRELTLGERIKYHLQRPFKLIQRHSASMWRLLTGDPATRATWHAQRDLQTWLRGDGK